VKYAGVAYLLFMAWTTWRDKGALAVKADGPASFAAVMRNRVLARPRVVAAMRRAFAATFVALAGRLALESR
jgi:threonine/homoserine/homoserine lactone efflux protein